MYKIETADSLEPKRFGSNSEKSNALHAIGTIILASFRVLHEQEDSLLSPNDNVTLYDNPHLEQYPYQISVVSAYHYFR